MTRPAGSRADDIRWELDRLQREGVVTDYYCQTKMPGRRWVIWGPGYERSLTTRQAEAFIDDLREYPDFFAAKAARVQ